MFLACSICIKIQDSRDNKLISVAYLIKKFYINILDGEQYQSHYPIALPSISRLQSLVEIIFKKFWPGSCAWLGREAVAQNEKQNQSIMKIRVDGKIIFLILKPKKCSMSLILWY